MFNYNKYDRDIGFRELKLNQSDLIVSKANLEGIITYANPSFIKITGYKSYELMDQNHNIIRHPDMPKALFAYIWKELKNGNDAYGFVKNLTKDGSFYWVFAYMVPDYNEKGSVIGYHSERRAPNPKAIAEISILYEQIKHIEIRDGIESAVAHLHDVASQRAKNYYNYVYKLQNQN
jgi:PAS domain S-box-containing protein